jgi:formylglycine-generating enzyme required for sulfatase activity
MIQNRTLLLGTMLLAGTLFNTVAEEAAKRKTDTIPMVLVDGGIFMMGKGGLENDGMPAHEVTVSSFSIGRTEVTQAQWKAVVGSDPQDFKGDDFPVTTVNWYEAVGFCNMLSEQAGLRTVYRIDKNVEDPDNQSRYDLQKWTVTCDWSADGFRLPTEAEWEYAARGGKSSKDFKYSGADAEGDVAWYGENSDDGTHPVGTKKPNELGLSDMSGNVWEWCWDWSDAAYYGKGENTDPRGPQSGGTRAFRGGGWGHGAAELRPENRGGTGPDKGMDDTGFRVVRSQNFPTGMAAPKLGKPGPA